MADGKYVSAALVQEGERVMRICNACRYCEGYCAVFPAMERRLTFAESDLNYLANLCHNCTECWYACQYAPPQEFELNFPQTLARIRLETYQKYAWPGSMAKLFRNNGIVTSLVTTASLIFILLVILLTSAPAALHSAHTDSQGAFYAVMSHSVMVATFSAVAVFVFVSFAVSFFRFCRDTGGLTGALFAPGIVVQAFKETLALKYLDGDGRGCAYPYEVQSDSRRVFHHFTFYGFMLCFAATAVGTVYHYAFGLHSPPPLNLLSARSLPVIFGGLGGIGLLAGPLGLLWLKTRRNTLLVDREQNGMDAGFLALLFLTSLTGFLLMGFRETVWCGTFVVLHLGVVMGLFLTMPYGKFVHGIYRFGALLRNALEERTMDKYGSE